MIYASPPNWLMIYMFFIYRVFFCASFVTSDDYSFGEWLQFLLYILQLSVEEGLSTSSMNASFHVFYKGQIHLPITITGV